MADTIVTSANHSYNWNSLIQQQAQYASNTWTGLPLGGTLTTTGMTGTGLVQIVPFPDGWQQISTPTTPKEENDMDILNLKARAAAAVGVGVATPIRKPISFDEFTADEEKEYKDLAAELGLDANNAFEQNRFKQFLSEKGLAPYNYDDVFSYLEKQYGPCGKANVGRGLPGMPTWGWKCLRQADITASGSAVHSWVYNKNGELQPAAGLYKKAVPLPVLLTVKDILKSFPKATFYVSDEVKAPIPVLDPFLLVYVAGKGHVVERWSEPSFRGTRE